MAIKDLLVAYQGDEGSRKALQFALQMSRKYQAHVTGAHIQGANQYQTQNRWIPEGVLDTIRSVEKEMMDAIRSSFEQTVQELSPGTETNWISGRGAPSLQLARLSRYFDILLTGQFRGAILHGGRAVQPEELIGRAGKPMIIVPQEYEVRPFNEYAVVAWDGSRGSARALTDAMQILETKTRLDILTVESGEQLHLPGDHDIIAHLKRHGIDARAVSLDLDGSVGRTILNYCEENDPDLLVMGAFGRGKLTAMLFGGVSQYILEYQTLPVMMSQ